MSTKPMQRKSAPVLLKEVLAPQTSRESGKTILLVEDEPILVSLYASVLRKLTEAKVITATEEQEAIRLIGQALPTIILLDLMIPTTAAGNQAYSFHEPVGFNVLRQVKANPKTRHIHVIIISNLDADEHKQRAHDLGAEDYIVKALLQPRELAKRIAKYLDNSEGKP